MNTKYYIFYIYYKNLPPYLHHTLVSKIDSYIGFKLLTRDSNVKSKSEASNSIQNIFFACVATNKVILVSTLNPFSMFNTKPARPGLRCDHGHFPSDGKSHEKFTLLSSLIPNSWNLFSWMKYCRISVLERCNKNTRQLLPREKIPVRKLTWHAWHRFRSMYFNRVKSTKVHIKMPSSDEQATVSSCTFMNGWRLFTSLLNSRVDKNVISPFLLHVNTLKRRQKGYVMVEFSLTGEKTVLDFFHCQTVKISSFKIQKVNVAPSSACSNEL